VLAVSSSGELVVLGVLLSVTSGSFAGVVPVVLALAAVALRFGTTSLDAIAGAQSVLGPAASVGPMLAAAASSCAAVALLLAHPGGWSVVPFGLVAALVVAGPAAGDAGDVVLRVVVSATAVGIAVGVDRLTRRRPARRRGFQVLATISALGALTLALAS